MGKSKEDRQFEVLDGRLIDIQDRLRKLKREDDKQKLLIQEILKAVKDIHPLPQPQPKQLEVKFVFKVADDHQSEPFSIAIGSVTDAEGQPISDPSSLSVKVVSSDENVVAVSFDEASKSGTVSFGSPGVASLTATVSNTKGDILGSGAADFTVTTGDPAAVSDVKLAFSGLTEEPPA